MIVSDEWEEEEVLALKAPEKAPRSRSRCVSDQELIGKTAEREKTGAACVPSSSALENDRAGYR